MLQNICSRDDANAILKSRQCHTERRVILFGKLRRGSQTTGEKKRKKGKEIKRNKTNERKGKKKKIKIKIVYENTYMHGRPRHARDRVRVSFATRVMICKRCANFRILKHAKRFRRARAICSRRSSARQLK